MSKRDVSDAISLFPFMSILACLIGTLTMIIALLALQQTSESEEQQTQSEKALAADPEAQARAEERQRLTQEQAALTPKLARLKQAVADLQTDRNYLAQARDRALADVEQAKAAKQAAEQAAAAADREHSQQLAELEKLAEKRKALEKELTERRSEQARLEQEVKKLDRPPNEARVVIQPGGSGVNLDAAFMECRDTGVVLLDEPKQPHIRTADLAESSEFAQALERVKARRNGTVVFLIRSNGLGSYGRASSIARSQYVTNGKLPVAGNGKIDLSTFRGK